MEDGGWAWLAGIVEGEGNISVHITHKPYGVGKYHYPQIRVRMTDEDVVRQCYTITGVGGVYGPAKHPSSNEQDKPYWQWTVTGGPCRVVLENILPFLGERRAARAQEVLSI